MSPSLGTPCGNDRPARGPDPTEPIKPPPRIPANLPPPPPFPRKSSIGSTNPQPPPPFESSRPPVLSGHGSQDLLFTTGIIAIIGILGILFVLFSSYAVVVEYCRSRAVSRRRRQRHEREEAGQQELTWPAITRGLDESLITMIPVCKYSKGEGIVDVTECAVCLTEFEESEALRLLPNCSHAFHVPCIDKWLQTHSNCPLCRANILSRMHISTPAQRPPMIDVDDETSGNSSPPEPVNGSLGEETDANCDIEERNNAQMPEQTAADGDFTHIAGQGQVSVEKGRTEGEAGNESRYQWKASELVKSQEGASERLSDESQAAEVAAPMRRDSACLVVNDGQEGRQEHGDEHTNKSSNSHMKRSYSACSFAEHVAIEIPRSNVEREQKSTTPSGRSGKSSRSGRAARTRSQSAMDGIVEDEMRAGGVGKGYKEEATCEAMTRHMRWWR